MAGCGLDEDRYLVGNRFAPDRRPGEREGERCESWYLGRERHINGTNPCRQSSKGLLWVVVSKGNLWRKLWVLGGHFGRQFKGINSVSWGFEEQQESVFFTDIEG